jgi:hypothetical protein
MKFKCKLDVSCRAFVNVANKLQVRFNKLTATQGRVLLPIYLESCESRLYQKICQGDTGPDRSVESLVLFCYAVPPSIRLWNARNAQ